MAKQRNTRAHRAKYLGAALFWLLAWELLAKSLHNSIVLVGPLEVAVRLSELAVTSEFWVSVVTSLSSVCAGFILGMLIGLCCAISASRWESVRVLLAPIMGAVQAIPVASFIILILIWVRPAQLGLIISLLMSAPIVYKTVLEGLDALPENLRDFAQVHKIRLALALKGIYAPQLKPYILSASNVAMGLSWKAGIAAEVIGQPTHSIGDALYSAKIFLETGDVLAWTLVILILALVLERVMRVLIDYALARYMSSGVLKPLPVAGGDILQTSYVAADILLTDVSKAYAGHTVFSHVNLQLLQGGVTCLLGESGTGKTTLARIVSGLERTDSGRVSAGEQTRFAYCFQDNLLIQELNAYQNIALTSGALSDQVVIELLDALGISPDMAARPVMELSGGQARRVELARTVLTPAQCYIFDEGMRGLDEKTYARVMKILAKQLQGKTVLWITHRLDDAQAFAACKIVKMEELTIPD